MMFYYCFFFFFNDTATTEIYTLSLHDALPIYAASPKQPDPHRRAGRRQDGGGRGAGAAHRGRRRAGGAAQGEDRKSTRLNSSHANISYAVFCLKKKIKHSPYIHTYRYEIHTPR